MDINIEQTQTILKIYAFILVIFLEILIPTIEADGIIACSIKFLAKYLFFSKSCSLITSLVLKFAR